VNESVQGGWLEFLNRVALKPEFRRGYEQGHAKDAASELVGIFMGTQPDGLSNTNKCNRVVTCILVLLCCPFICFFRFICKREGKLIEEEDIKQTIWDASANSSEIPDRTQALKFAPLSAAHTLTLQSHAHLAIVPGPIRFPFPLPVPGLFGVMAEGAMLGATEKALSITITSEGRLVRTKDRHQCIEIHWGRCEPEHTVGIFACHTLAIAQKGQLFVVNRDHTVSPKHAPSLVLGVMATRGMLASDPSGSPNLCLGVGRGLILVPAGDPRSCVFDQLPPTADG